MGSPRRCAPSSSSCWPRRCVVMALLCCWSSRRRCGCCRWRWRWPPPALTFGLLALLGGSLTMASIAVLPVLIGLAVDYAIQFQARFREARAGGPGSRPGGDGRRGRRRSGDRHRLPGDGGAASPRLPSRRSRWCAPSAFCWSRGSRSPSPSRSPRGSPPSPSPAGARSARRAAPDHCSGSAPRSAAAAPPPPLACGRRGSAALAVAITCPGRVLSAAVILAVCGWIAGAGTHVVSDIRDLAPSSLPALRDVN